MLLSAKLVEQRKGSNGVNSQAWISAVTGGPATFAVTPNLGCSASVGSTWVSEPDPKDLNIGTPGQEGNWCGPGAATNVFLHWNYTAVFNHPDIAVPSGDGTNPNITFTYKGAQAWMSDFAASMPFTDSNSKYHQGVMNRPYSGDIGSDGHPMIYSADTKYLAGWTWSGISHYVEGYGYNDNGTTQYVSYADSMWTSAQGAPGGDHTIPASQMWNGVNSGGTDLIIF